VIDMLQSDVEDYGTALIDMTQRAAREVMAPELQRLHAENQQLRGMAQRSQRAEIERALDQSGIDWRSIYANPQFAAWLSEFDPYSAVPRSQLMRRAVANGDSNRVVNFYRGFIAEAGHPPASSQRNQRRSPAAASGQPIYTRDAVKQLYERRRKGEIGDAAWARTEQEIFAAANQGRIAGALDKDGNKLTELR
jgi:hypothetical protein